MSINKTLLSESKQHSQVWPITVTEWPTNKPALLEKRKQDTSVGKVTGLTTVTVAKFQHTRVTITLSSTGSWVVGSRPGHFTRWKELGVPTELETRKKSLCPCPALNHDRPARWPGRYILYRLPCQCRICGLSWKPISEVLTKVCWFQEYV